MSNLLVTKAEKKIAEDMTYRAMDGRLIDISNQFEHEVATKLVEVGMAIITKKKNYGRIAQIRGIRV